MTRDHLKHLPLIRRILSDERDLPPLPLHLLVLQVRMLDLLLPEGLLRRSRLRLLDPLLLPLQIINHNHEQIHFALLPLLNLNLDQTSIRTRTQMRIGGFPELMPVLVPDQIPVPIPILGLGSCRNLLDLPRHQCHITSLNLCSSINLLLARFVCFREILGLEVCSVGGMSFLSYVVGD